VIFSLLGKKRGVHLEELRLQVVLKRVQSELRSSICLTFQDKRFLGFTLVTFISGIQLIFVHLNFPTIKIGIWSRKKTYGLCPEIIVKKVQCFDLEVLGSVGFIKVV
jgi:hypothetical protein